MWVQVPVEGKQFHSCKLFPLIFLSLWQKFMESCPSVAQIYRIVQVLHNVWGKDPKERSLVVWMGTWSVLRKSSGDSQLDPALGVVLINTLVFFTLSETWALNGLWQFQLLISEPPRLDRTFQIWAPIVCWITRRQAAGRLCTVFHINEEKTTTICYQLPAATKASPLFPLDLQVTSCPNVVKMYWISLGRNFPQDFPSS